MKIKFSLSLIGLMMVALVILGSAAYIYAHPNAYPEDNRGKFKFKVLVQELNIHQQHVS